MASVLQRLKERKLVQWLIAYLAGGWVVLEVVDLVGSHFGWPESVYRGLLLLFAVGIFIALVLAWYHGEKGQQRVSGPELIMLSALLNPGGFIGDSFP